MVVLTVIISVIVAFSEPLKHAACLAWPGIEAKTEIIPQGVSLHRDEVSAVSINDLITAQYGDDANDRNSTPTHNCCVVKYISGHAYACRLCACRGTEACERCALSWYVAIYKQAPFS